jgi:glutathione peroxidase
MNRTFRAAFLAATLTLGAAAHAEEAAKPAAAPAEQPANAGEKATVQSPLDFTVKDIDGNDVDLSKYKGKVVLIVNTASKCGLTPQYEALQALNEKYKDQGLAILGFPANNFNGQEPGSNQEIKLFCAQKYDVDFDMFSKISVKGEDIHPLFQYLTSEETNKDFAGEIAWNFNKFLIGRDGKVIGRFEPKKTPNDPEVVQAVEKALTEKVAAK